MMKAIPYILTGILLIMVLFFALEHEKEDEGLSSYKPPVEQSLPNFTFKTYEWARSMYKDMFA